MRVMIPVMAGYGASDGLLTTKEVRLAENLGARPFPHWAGGALLSLDAGEGESIGISVFGPSGEKQSAFHFALPGVRYMNIRCYTRADDGTIALGGSMVSQEGKSAPFLAMMNGDGSNLKLVRTGNFRAMSLTCATDGSLWAGGYETAEKPAGREKSTFEESLQADAGAIRQFDRTGKQTRSRLPQARVAGILADLIHGETLFAFVGPELHWYSTKQGHHLKILVNGEFQRITSSPLPQGERATGFAVNSKGEVYACSSGENTWNLRRLDLATGAWHSERTIYTADKASLPLRVRLIGAEQDTLVSLSADAQFLQFLKRAPIDK
jgi:hypothetical protein